MEPDCGNTIPYPVLIYLNGANGFSPSQADFVCLQAGYPLGSLFYANARFGDHFPHPWATPDLRCVTDEASHADCPLLRRLGERTSLRYRIASVSCRRSANETGPPEVELVDGPSSLAAGNVMVTRADGFRVG